MQPRSSIVALALMAMSSLAFASGCSTARGSAVRTGDLRLPPNIGPISVYATEIPTGARELGVVEAHAYGEDGDVETLLPVLLQKTAQLGGNGVVIDGVHADFRIVDRPRVETFAYPCGWRTCVSTRVYSAAEEVMIVSMHGRALFLGSHQ
ncbi:MAG: hypothetical protein ABI551_12440 [Polyangiaceae bacterium]